MANQDLALRTVGGALPPLLSVDATRRACGGRGRGWVYERLRTGDFECIVDGRRRLIVTESVLAFIQRKREGTRTERKAENP